MDIDKLKKIPSDLSSLKSKVDKLDIGKSETTNDVVEKTEHSATIKNIED